KLASTPGDDQLVYLLDYGTALQIARRYEESNAAHIAADDLAEIQDNHSISTITGSLLFNEEMVQYKGEHFEKVLINAFLAINFVMLGRLDEALVETRRLHEKLDKLRLDGVAEFDRNEFALYLSALLSEADGDWDNAYITF